MPSKIQRLLRIASRPFRGLLCSMLASAVAAGRPERAASLLAWGADPNAPSAHGTPPLCSNHTFPDARCAAMAKVLLAAGADPASRSRDGRTALHFAAEFALPELCLALLEAGADPDARIPSSGETPIDRLRAFGDRHGADLRGLVESTFERHALRAAAGSAPAARSRPARL